MDDLKILSKDAIPSALEKAKQYRLLNEPAEAESICLDILNVEPDHQAALIVLILALTDRFNKSYGVNDIPAEVLLGRLRSEYDRIYYAGIIAERKAKAKLSENFPTARYIAFDFLIDAMNHFARAQQLKPPGNDDALLRWNTCVRIMTHNHLGPRPADNIEPSLE